MLIPDSWGGGTRGEAASNPRGKRPPEALQKETTKRRKQKPLQRAVDLGSDPASGCDLDTYDKIARSISCAPQSTSPAVPELDSILSRIPYRQILEELFGGETRLQPEVPLVTRAYEESFMRSPGKDERPCAMGSECECMFIDPQQPFVGTEFLIPSEEETRQPQMCVLCCRKVTQQLFHDMLFGGVSFRGVIQRYGNICEQPGEYARQVMLICPPNGHVHCLPLPIVSHQRNRYSVRASNGTKYLRQHRVSFEDFRLSPEA